MISGKKKMPWTEHEVNLGHELNTRLTWGMNWTRG